MCPNPLPDASQIGGRFAFFLSEKGIGLGLVKDTCPRAQGEA